MCGHPERGECVGGPRNVGQCREDQSKVSTIHTSCLQFTHLTQISVDNLDFVEQLLPM